MTCVPCVAVLEPESAPESRTDSKRDSEEEPVRELEVEERRENIERRRVCERGTTEKLRALYAPLRNDTLADLVGDNA